MQALRQSGKSFRPYQIEDTYALTPDHPDFHKLQINLAILTKYGRGIYIRHGNEDRCSSFFATLGTIVNKLQISFGKAVQGKQQSAGMCLVDLALKYIKQGDLKVLPFTAAQLYVYLLVEGSYNRGTYSKRKVTLYAMMELVHHQLMSCLTGKVNNILETNQTYDPSINFGKTRTQHLLLHYAFANGLNSLPVTFNAIPVMPLPSQTKAAISSLLRQQKIQGLQINIVMTLGEVVCIHKQKGIDLTTYDIFLFHTLIQSQSSLFRSEIWYPICLPGVSFQDRVFCYINFLTEQLIHIMVSDQAQIFPELSQASKRLRTKITEKSLIERINLSITKQLISDPTLQKSSFLKHFVCRYAPSDQNVLGQMVMSNGSYFGRNQADFAEYFPLYGELLKHHSCHKTGKKQKIHIQSLGNDYVGGYCEEGNVAIFFICSYLSELEDCKHVCNTLCKFVKQEENSLWIQKFI